MVGATLAVALEAGGYLLPLRDLAFCLRFSLRAALPVFLPPPPPGFGRLIAGILAPSPPYCLARRAHGPFPLATWRIMVRISLNCSSSWLTSCTLVPLPRAIRLRRLPLIISGFRRSSKVI